MHNNDLFRHDGLTLVPFQRHLLRFVVTMQGVMLAALLANSQTLLQSAEPITRIIETSREDIV